MARLTREQTEQLKGVYGVDQLWSFSRFNSYYEDPWRFAMTYIKKIERSENVYSHFGTKFHDLIQGYYDGAHKYEDMIDIYNKEVMAYELDNKGLKFINDNVRINYFASLRDYFQNTEIIQRKVINEVTVLIPLYDKTREKNVLFAGYIDSLYLDEDGICNIVDFKTSSKSGFSGAKLSDNSRQLKLYCIGLHKTKGIPYDKIRMRFDMMKYYDVQYQQKNGKIGSSKQERHKWVATQLSKLRKELFALDFDPFEVDEILEKSVEDNSIANLPQEVQDKFNLANCYIDVTIDEKEAEELEQFICDVVNDAENQTKLAHRIGLEEAFPEPEINGSNRFFYEQLAPNFLKHHKKYKEEQELLRAKEGNDTTDDFLLDLFKDFE